MRMVTRCTRWMVHIQLWAVDRCGDYRYDFTDGTYQVVSAETFEDTEWSVRLLMEGERRMEHNLNKRETDAENVALGCDGSD